MKVFPRLSPRKWVSGTLCLALTIFSVFVAFSVYPGMPYILFAALAAMSFSGAVLNAGCAVSLGIAGTYLGIFLDVGVKSGPSDAQMSQTVATVLFMTLVGVVVGFMIDLRVERKSKTPQEK